MSELQNVRDELNALKKELYRESQMRFIAEENCEQNANEHKREIALYQTQLEIMTKAVQGHKGDMEYYEQRYIDARKLLVEHNIIDE